MTSLPSSMHIRIATFDAPSSRLDAVVEHFRTESLRVFSAHAGFLGYQAFVDRDRGRMVGLSRWRSLAELEASAESGRGIIQGAVDLGAVMVGDPQVLAQAFDVSPDSATPASPRKPVVLKAGGGRAYPMGRISAVFKADGEETADRYSISEWWLEPDTTGPGAHAHDEDDVFYVLEGTMSFLLGGEWIDAGAGSFVLVPGGMTHDFQNRSQKRAGVLNVSAPGGFEPSMPAINEWFREHPPGSTGP